MKPSNHRQVSRRAGKTEQVSVKKARERDEISKKSDSRLAGVRYTKNAPMPFLRTTVDSIQLAKYFVAMLGPMPHLKLQKLVFYAQAWHLAIFDEPLIDDDFQAWAHGPVSRKVWDKFKTPESPVLGVIKLDAAAVRSTKSTFQASVTPEQKDLLDDVIKEYGPHSAYHLECLTHAERPWRDMRQGLDPAAKSTAVITKSAIKTYYRSRLKKA